MTRFVLASTSPRRRRMLSELGFDFDVADPDIDESRLPHESPYAMAERLAVEKAQAVTSQLPVLAADTIVVLRGEVMGKPDDADHAEALLRSLSGAEHTVATGVALVTGEWTRSIVVTAEVEFGPLDDDLIRWYVETGEPLDKAGAYGLAGAGAALVRRLAGSHSAVIGLPLHETLALLASADIRPSSG